MAKLSKTEGKRYGNIRYRLRYRICFPDGSWVDKSRRYETSAKARAKLEIATVLRELLQMQEEKTIWEK